MHILFVTSNILVASEVINPIETYLLDQGISWSITKSHTVISSEYDVIILVSYRKIIPSFFLQKVGGKVIVFHSSDLPEGKGWAPIYNTIANDKEYVVQTMCYADDKVDSGDILVKCKTKVLPHYTASMVRKLTRYMTSKLIENYIHLFKENELIGMPQDSEKETFFTRRTPEDSQIDIESKFIDQIPHLLALEDEHKAFFYHKNEKFYVTVEPENKTIEYMLIFENYFRLCSKK